MHIFSEQEAQMSAKKERERTQKKKSARQLCILTVSAVQNYVRFCC